MSTSIQLELERHGRAVILSPLDASLGVSAHRYQLKDRATTSKLLYKMFLLSTELFMKNVELNNQHLNKRRQLI